MKRSKNGSVADAFSNTEMLSNANLSPPLLTQLFQQNKDLIPDTKANLLPLTIDEATSLVRKCVSRFT